MTQTQTGVLVVDTPSASLSKHWGLLLSFGILMIGLGIAMMVWPHITVGAVAILLGISLLVSGVFSLVGSFTQPQLHTGGRVLMGVSGALSILVGLMCFRSIFQAVAILAIFVGIGWLFRGIMDLIAGFGAAKGTPGRGWAIAGGIVAVLAGLAVLAWPGVTLVALAWISGLSMVVIGIVEIVAAFSLRKLAKAEALTA